MAIQLYSDVVSAEVEAVVPLLTGMYDQANTLYNKFSKVQASEQSGRDNRMPMVLRPGGSSRAINIDGGSFGTGTGPKIDHTAMSPIDHALVIAWSLKTKFTTDSNKKAVVDTVQLTIAETMKELRTRTDKYLNLPLATGVLGTATAYGAAVYTFATGGLRTRSMRAGDEVQVQQGTSDLGIRRITSIDQDANQVTLASAPSGSPASGDRFIVSGLDATTTSNVWYYPLAYNHNNSTAGSFLGKTRSDYPEFRTPTVSANSGALTPDILNQALVALDVTLGEDVTNTGDWFWYFNPKHQYNLIQFLTMISEVSLGGSNSQIDAGFSRKNQRKFCGIPIETNINADETRVDLIDGKNWIRAVYKDVGWIPFGGRTVAPVPNSTSYDASEMSVLQVSQQFAVRNPRRGVYCSSIVTGV